MLPKKEIIFVTQSIDPRRKSLGFTIDWIYCFRKVFEVSTISQDGIEFQNYAQGNYVIGKKNKLIKLICFIKIIFLLNRKKEQIIFVHMIPIYALILIFLKKILNIKKIYLWFAHKEKPCYFWVLHRYLDGIFTTSSHVLPEKYTKVSYLGHGISIKKFEKEENFKKIKKRIEFIYVGRLTRIKNIFFILSLVNKVSNELKVKITMTLLGSPVTKSDQIYSKEMKNFANSLKGNVDYRFIGEIEFSEVNRFYNENTIGINASPTGAIDKAPIEGVFSNTPFFYINDAFNDLYNECPTFKGLMQLSGNLESDKNVIINFLRLDEKIINKGCKELKEISIEKFGLKNFFNKLIYELQK